jgi:hypothetical protein
MQRHGFTQVASPGGQVAITKRLRGMIGQEQLGTGGHMLADAPDGPREAAQIGYHLVCAGLVKHYRDGQGNLFRDGTVGGINGLTASLLTGLIVFHRRILARHPPGISGRMAATGSGVFEANFLQPGQINVLAIDVEFCSQNEEVGQADFTPIKNADKMLQVGGIDLAAHDVLPYALDKSGVV